MTSQQRIEHFNNWPKAQKFKGESDFSDILKSHRLEELFYPYQLPGTDSTEAHIMLSYLLDAVDSLPMRPDHAFDWTWRAFEYSLKHIPSCKGNITKSLRAVSDKLSNYLGLNPDVEDALYGLVDKIPLRTCKYLLKKIVEEGVYTFSSDADVKGLSSFAKRLLFVHGKPPVYNVEFQELLQYFAWHYRSVGGVELRRGASLLRRVIRGETINANGKSYQLDRKEILFLLLSGLGYAFRNGRAHAESIAPFRSSLAKLQTYAHCWFMFLLMYELTFTLLHLDTHPEKITGNPAANFKANNHAYEKLFGASLND